MENGFLLFWHEHGSDLSNGAIVLSALAAFIVIGANRANAKRSETLRLILHIESDKDLIDARKKFLHIKKGRTKPEEYGSEAARDGEEAFAIRTVLNIHELVAVSINEGVIHERVFRRWYNKAYIDDFESMTGYINVVRTNRKNPKIFAEFEDLAKKWRDDKSWYASPNFFNRKWSAFLKFLRA